MKIALIHRAEVNFSQGNGHEYLTVQAAYTKIGETRTIPMNTVLRTVLEILRAATPDAEGPIFRGWKGARRG